MKVRPWGSRLSHWPDEIKFVRHGGSAREPLGLDVTRHGKPKHVPPRRHVPMKKSQGPASVPLWV